MRYNYGRCKMKKSSKKRIKHKNILILVVLLFIIAFITSLFLNNDNSDNKNIYMIDVTNKEVDTVYELLKDYNLDIDTSYEYDDIIKKDYIISQSIVKDTIINEGDKLSLVISRGKLDKDKLKED